MSDAGPHPVFPLVRALVVITALAAALWALGLLVLPGTIGPVEIVRRGLHAAALLIWGLNVASVIVVKVADPFGVKVFTATYFASVFVRMAGVLLGARILIVAGWIESGKPLAISLALMYLPLLAAEVAIIAIHLRKKYPSPSAKGDHGGADGPATREVGA